MKDINIQSIDSGVDLLIGTNASKLLEPWELVNSQGDGPYAVRTLLGWVIDGPLRRNNIIRDKNGCPAAAALNSVSIVNKEDLQVIQHNNNPSKKNSKETEEMPREDKPFLNIMNHSAKMSDGHYCLDLPFRQENPSLPNNKHVTEQLICDFAVMVPGHRLNPSDRPEEVTDTSMQEPYKERLGIG